LIVTHDDTPFDSLDEESWRRDPKYDGSSERTARRSRKAGQERKAVQTVETKPHDPRPPVFSDEALALRFAEIHAGDLRYVAAWNKWLSWNTACWLFDTTLAAWDEARKICRAAAAECNKTKLAAALASGKTVAAVIGLARPWSNGTPIRGRQTHRTA
jgi:hypothetical protein